MTKYRPLLLIAICLALGVFVWLDNSKALLSLWATATPPASPARTQTDGLGSATSEPNPEQSSAAEVSLVTGNPLASFDKASLENWVQRPLFAPSRRRPPPQEAKKAREPLKPPPEYRLLGVLLNPNGMIALLRSEDTGIDFHVQPGDVLRGWLVASVERNAVTLKRDGETSQVITFKN